MQFIRHRSARVASRPVRTSTLDSRMPKNPKKSVAPPNGQSRITPRVSRATARNRRRDRARRIERKHFHSIDSFARAPPHRRVRRPRHLHRPLGARVTLKPHRVQSTRRTPRCASNAWNATSTRARNEAQRRAREETKSRVRRHLRHGDLTGERAARKGGCEAIVVEEGKQALTSISMHKQYTHTKKTPQKFILHTYQ